jgi:hypothetical protein
MREGGRRTMSNSKNVRQQRIRRSLKGQEGEETMGLGVGKRAGITESKKLPREEVGVPA